MRRSRRSARWRSRFNGAGVDLVGAITFSLLPKREPTLARLAETEQKSSKPVELELELELT